MKTLESTKQRKLCVNVSRRHDKDVELLEDYMLEFNLGLAPTIFRILREYNHMKCVGGLIR